MQMRNLRKEKYGFWIEMCHAKKDEYALTGMMQMYFIRNNEQSFFFNKYFFIQFYWFVSVLPSILFYQKAPSCILSV